MEQSAGRSAPSCYYARFRRLLKGHICLAEAAAPSDSVSWAPCTNVLTYFLLFSPNLPTIVTIRFVTHLRAVWYYFSRVIGSAVCVANRLLLFTWLLSSSFRSLLYTPRDWRVGIVVGNVYYLLQYPALRQTVYDRRYMCQKFVPTTRSFPWMGRLIRIKI